MHRLSPLVLLFAMGLPPQQGSASAGELREVRRFTAPEARQGVAVDAKFVYAIDSRAIGKYDKTTGKSAGRWEAEDDGPIRHLNGGVVVGGTLYCANSNHPDVPMKSTIEMFDPETMTHVGRHDFGVFLGSATWIDDHDGAWWIVFAHYERNKGGLPDKGPEWTTLARFDRAWNLLGQWRFPAALIERFRPYSNSGGSWGADGLLYASGHDRPELHALRLPPRGDALELVRTLRVPTAGQGIAWDRTEPGKLYAVHRPAREVVALEVRGLDRE